MSFRKQYIQDNAGLKVLCFIILALLVILSVAAVSARADDALAGFGAPEDPNSWGNSDPAPFSLRIRFDDKYERLTEEDTRNWRRLTPDGFYIWDNEAVDAYLESLKKRYDSETGSVSFTTHKGVKMKISSQNCGWHMNIEMSRINLEEGADKGEKVIDPAWNSGCVYSSKNDVGDHYVEVSIEEQKVFLVEDYEIIFETDCVTGTCGYTDTTKGVFQVQGKSSPATLKDEDKNGNKYEQPVEYWIAFNGSQGMHDAIWRGEFGGEIYKSWGSHGCVNLPLDAAKRIYEEVYMYYPVIVY